MDTKVQQKYSSVHMSAIKIKTYQCHKYSINLDNFRFFCIPIIQRWDNYLREYAEENSIQFYRTCHKKEREICMWENKKRWFSSLVKHKWIHAGIFIVFHFVQIFFFFFFRTVILISCWTIDLFCILIRLLCEYSSTTDKWQFYSEFMKQ